MSDRPSPQYRGLFATALLLIAVGWTGLYLLFATTLPLLGPRWLFFFLLTLAATGTALPFLWLLHRRFRARRAATSRVLLRQALWFAFFTALCTWLQINRALNLPLALLLAAGFVVLEWFPRRRRPRLWG